MARIRSIKPGFCTSEAIDVTHHFADVPRAEVGDTTWIIRGEGS